MCPYSNRTSPGLTTEVIVRDLVAGNLEMQMDMTLVAECLRAVKCWAARSRLVLYTRLSSMAIIMNNRSRLEQVWPTIVDTTSIRPKLIFKSKAIQTRSQATRLLVGQVVVAMIRTCLLPVRLASQRTAVPQSMVVAPVAKIIISSDNK